MISDSIIRTILWKMKISLIFITTIFSVVKTAVIINSQQMKFREIAPTPEGQLLKEDKLYWWNKGGDELLKRLEFAEEVQRPIAKNVIIFIGDGMGISTITATRIYKGQRVYDKSGEDHSLVYDNFPNSGLVKTYNVDMQVPDSAGTATALFTGIKTRYEAIGVDVQSNKTVFDKNVYLKSRVESIMTWAQEANKDTGIITTTRITHATPAATYSQVNSRKWECDSKIPKEHRSLVKDIARQLIEDAPGRNFKVILGGGYQQLGYTTQDSGLDECVRQDGLNLTEVWLKTHNNATFVTTTEELERVSDETNFLLGLFHPDNLPYEIIRDTGPKGTPSLTEMTRKGLQILKKNPSGFVLMVEGGRIDHGHHKNYARVALEESAEFDKAIALAVAETGPDTLIIVTADHSHALTLNGYSKRGNDILGYGIKEGVSKKKPALTLTYANGPGFPYHFAPNTSILHPWIDVQTDGNRLINPQYQHLAAFELEDETHGGEDVGIFACGPGSHLIRGVMEQNYVAHLISYASCIGPRAAMNPHCKTYAYYSNSSHYRACSLLLAIILFMCVMF